MVHGWRSSAAPVLASLCLTLVAADARAGCEKDTDCKGERVCTAGRCVQPPGAGTCNVDKDCPGEQTCDNGKCSGLLPGQRPRRALNRSRPCRPASGVSRARGQLPQQVDDAGWSLGAGILGITTGVVVLGLVILPR